MLTSPQPQRGARRPAQSLRQAYGEFILQRIEEFKEQHTREQLLSIADEALRELEAGEQDQLVLTEVLMQEHVDRVIMRQLRLPAYRRWRERHLRLRAAQREPTHWALEPDTPLADLAARLEPHDVALVVGAGAGASALFLAAHDVTVVLIDADPAAVDAVEHRAAAEGLGSRFETIVVYLDDWFPDVSPALAVIDAASLSTLDSAARGKLVDTLQRKTIPGGIHCVLPGEKRDGVLPLAPDAIKAHYQHWGADRSPRGRSRWFVAIKPGSKAIAD